MNSPGTAGKGQAFSAGWFQPHGRSAVNIFSFANGALGEHRRQDTAGMRLEIEAPRAGGGPDLIILANGRGRLFWDSRSA
jgi:hypothetical protein